jgi:hypothetical protein
MISYLRVATLAFAFMAFTASAQDSDPDNPTIVEFCTDPACNDGEFGSIDTYNQDLDGSDHCLGSCKNLQNDF